MKDRQVQKVCRDLLVAAVSQAQMGRLERKVTVVIEEGEVCQGSRGRQVTLEEPVNQA